MCLVNSNGILFYWLTTVSTLMMLLFAILVWFKKAWDFIKPVHENDSSMTIPPQNRYLKALYDFSFDIMSHAVWRTIIYLNVVIILVTVSLLHLVRIKLIRRKSNRIKLFTFTGWVQRWIFRWFREFSSTIRPIIMPSFMGEMINLFPSGVRCSNLDFYLVSLWRNVLYLPFAQHFYFSGFTSCSNYWSP